MVNLGIRIVLCKKRFLLHPTLPPNRLNRLNHKDSDAGHDFGFSYMDDEEDISSNIEHVEYDQLSIDEGVSNTSSDDDSQHVLVVPKNKKFIDPTKKAVSEAGNDTTFKTNTKNVKQLEIDKVVPVELGPELLMPYFLLF